MMRSLFQSPVLLSCFSTLGCFSMLMALPVMVTAKDSAEQPMFKKTPSAEADLIQLQDDFLEILPEARKAVVCVKFKNSSGSGVIVTSDGLVLTAGHVSGKPDQKLHVILEDGRKLEAVTLGRSDFADSGLIQITDTNAVDIPYRPMAPSDKSVTGDWVFAMGHPGGYNKARGSVVRLGRIISKRSARMRTDAKVVMGDSGGPLFNFDGEVIGINSRIGRNPTENYHCPIEAYHADMAPLLGGSVVSRQGGYLGAAVRKEAEGLVIRLIVDGSAADKAGLQEGDIVLSVKDEECLDEDEWKTRIGVHEIGERITLKVERDGEILDFNVKLTKRPRR